VNRLLLPLFFVLLLIAACAGDKTGKGRYSYPLPKLFSRSGDTNIISDRLYLIGWSADGKLAYLNEPGDEACGCYFMDLYVRDAVQNKELYHYHFSNEGQDEGERSDDDLATIWKRRGQVFTDSLNYYGIIPGNFTAGRGDSYETDSGKIHAALYLQITDNKDFGMSTIPEYRVLMERRTSAIPVYVSTEEEQNKPLLHVVSDAVISEPSGHYAAVLIAREYRGWEGPPNTWRYEVYTCRFK